MFINSDPLVIVYFTLNGTVTDNSTAEDIIEVMYSVNSVVNNAAIYEAHMTTDFSHASNIHRNHICKRFVYGFLYTGNYTKPISCGTRHW